MFDNLTAKLILACRLSQQCNNCQHSGSIKRPWTLLVQRNLVYLGKYDHMYCMFCSSCLFHAFFFVPSPKTPGCFVFFQLVFCVSFSKKQHLLSSLTIDEHPPLFFWLLWWISICILFIWLQKIKNKNSWTTAWATAFQSTSNCGFERRDPQCLKCVLVGFLGGGV